MSVTVIDFTHELSPDKPSNVKACFTTRLGGVSPAPYKSLNFGGATGDRAQNVAANEALLFSHLGLDPGHGQGQGQGHWAKPVRWLYAKQVHGDQVFVDDGTAKGLVGEYDALVSPFKNVVLTTYHADCMPVLARCKATGVVGAAHAGWKGVYLEVAQKMVEAMVAQGAVLSEICLVVGPGISQGAYAVSEALAVQFIDRFGAGPSSEVVTYNQGLPHLSLVACLSQTLEKAGIAPQNTHFSNLCTAGREDLFYSHRRDGEKTGRMLSLIAELD